MTNSLFFIIPFLVSLFHCIIFIVAIVVKSWYLIYSFLKQPVFQITVILYLKILCMVPKSRKLPLGTSKRAQKLTKDHRQRMFLNISLLLILYFISWCPQYITQILTYPGVGVSVGPAVRYGSFLMFYLNLVFDPLVYAFHTQLVKDACCGWCRKVTDQLNNSNVLENISVSNVLASKM